MFRASIVAILALLMLSGMTVVLMNDSYILNHEEFNSFANTDYSEVSDNAPWAYQNQNQQNTGYSPQTIINTTNVGSLQKVWATELNGLTGTPVIVNGIVYLTGGGQGVVNVNSLYALNESTGAVIWQADAKTIGYKIRTNCGVTVANGTVFAGTTNNGLISLNATTGDLNWEVSIIGNLTGYVYPYEGAEATPLVYDGKVILGETVADNGARGVIQAFSANNGTLLWTYYTVPPEPTNATNQAGYLNPDGSLSWGTNGTNGCDCAGGAVWNVPAVDPHTGIIYFGTANPYPFGSLVRSPNSTYCTRWSDSVIALNSTTGQPDWQFQEVCDDQYDLDQGMPLQLFNTSINGVSTEIVGAGGKPGYYFELDAENGTMFYNVTVGIHLNSYQTPPDCNCTIYPGGNGGINTFSTYDPMTNMIYTEANNQANICPTGGCTNNSTLYAIDASTGTIVWNWNLSMIAGGVSSSNDLVFTSGNHTFLAFNAETGAVLWNYSDSTGTDTYRWQWGPPSVTDGMLFETTWGSGGAAGTGPANGYAEAYAIPETVTFQETGLPADTQWHVTFNDTVYSGTSSNISVPSVSYGQYKWQMSSKSISGGKGVRYEPAVTSGTIISPPQLLVTVPYLTQYKVNIKSSNSTEGSIAPAAVNWVNANSSLSISATANSGFNFIKWEVSAGANITIQYAKSADTVAVVNGPGTIKAKFGT